MRYAYLEIGTFRYARALHFRALVVFGSRQLLNIKLTTSSFVTKTSPPFSVLERARRRFSTSSTDYGDAVRLIRHSFEFPQILLNGYSTALDVGLNTIPDWDDGMATSCIVARFSPFTTFVVNFLHGD